MSRRHSLRREAKQALLVAVLLLVAGAGAVAQDGEPDALEMYRNRDFAGAVKTTLAEIEANPNNIESYVVLGWSLIGAGRYQEAVDYALQALQINQFESRVLQILAEAHLNLGNSMQSLEYLERYVQVAPTGQFIDWIYSTMGEIFIQFGEFHRADIALTTSVFHNSRSANRWSRLGYAREQLEDWTEALSAYERALQLDPSFSDAVRGRQRVRAQTEG